MNGPIGLHGGGEYLAGDERFLDALLAAAADSARARLAGEGLDELDVSGHALETAAATIRALVAAPRAVSRGVGVGAVVATCAL